MKAATYLSLVTLALCATALSACGGSHEPKRAAGDTLTVYASMPHQGPSARMADAVAVGARLALADAGGSAGGKRIRLVELDSSRPEGETWDPSVVRENAQRAADDPTAIAYIGELDEGGSAISVPVTNNAGVLQVSPLDGLTTLTREQPGAPPGTGPARYYPSGQRTFLRLVPTDAAQASALVAWARERGARRLAVVQDEEVFGRVLAQQVVAAAERARLPVTDLAEPHEDPATFVDFATKLAATRPDAIVYTGVGDARAGLLLAALERAIPRARVFGSSALATAVPAPAGLPVVELLSPVLPASVYGPPARRVLKAAPRGGGEALYGYEAMRVVLDAMAAAGTRAGDRQAVARAALAPRARSSVIGAYRVLPGGDVSPARFGAYDHSASATRYLGPRAPQP
jgi:branched-chain amino acid transport system substrate-binding protein